MLRKNKEIDHGDWDYYQQLFSIFLNIENGSSNDLLDSTKTISYIKNDGCQEYWKKQNLLQEIDGIILRIDTEAALYGVHSFIYEDRKTKDTIRYEPKFIGHPWLNEKISEGDRVSKASNSLLFKITKPNGEVFTVSEHNE